MPSATLRPCNHPGCPELVASGYCPKHQKASKARRAGKVTDPFYKTARWRKVRDRYLRRQPLCESCAARGITKQADMVDHRQEIRDGGPKLDPENLQALCWACHGRKTADARAARVF
jgi:5-methylcytosine-specific restriction protein A